MLSSNWWSGIICGCNWKMENSLGSSWAEVGQSEDCCHDPLTLPLVISRSPRAEEHKWKLLCKSSLEKKKWKAVVWVCYACTYVHTISSARSLKNWCTAFAASSLPLRWARGVRSFWKSFWRVCCSTSNSGWSSLSEACCCTASWSSSSSRARSRTWFSVI